MKFLPYFLFANLLIVPFTLSTANLSNIVTQKSNDSLSEELATSYLNKTTVPPIPNHLTLTEAKTIQNQFITAIIPQLGKPVGYKAGLTNQSIQAKFNLSEPLRGILLEKMLLKNPAIVANNFGIKPVLEGDLMVRIGSEDINTATTHQEILASLDAVIPFVELPDLVYDQGVSINAPKLLVINLGARLGVIGEPIALQPTPEWENRLENVEVIILDESGNQLATGKSDALLEHPLNVVLWLRDSLKAEGKTLKPGDLLSLGSITTMIAIPENSTIRVQFLGLNPEDAAEISIQFKDSDQSSLRK